MSTSIDLAAPRIIVIEDRGKTFRLTAARIGAAAWLKYFKAIVNTSEMVDGQQVNSFDSSAARLELAEAALTDAEGYPERDGKPVTATPDWQKKLPLRHRATVGNILVNARVSETRFEGEEAFGFETVFLDAMWGAGDAGGMRELRGLRHTFETPTVEHQRRFARQASRSTVVGGSRSGKTVWTGAQAVLVELYDELIESVEGYTMAGGLPLGTREEIAANMDLYHKFVAADALFSPAMPKLDDEEG